MYQSISIVISPSKRSLTLPVSVLLLSISHSLNFIVYLSYSHSLIQPIYFPILLTFPLSILPISSSRFSIYFYLFLSLSFSLILPISHSPSLYRTLSLSPLSNSNSFDSSLPLPVFLTLILPISPHSPLSPFPKYISFSLSLPLIHPISLSLSLPRPYSSSVRKQTQKHTASTDCLPNK